MLWNISGYGRRGSVAGIPVFTVGKDVSAIDILSIQRQNYVNRFTRKSLSARYSQSLQMGRLFIYAFSPCHSFICPAIHINISPFSQHFYQPRRYLYIDRRAFVVFLNIFDDSLENNR